MPKQDMLKELANHEGLREAAYWRNEGPTTAGKGQVVEPGIRTSIG